MADAYVSAPAREPLLHTHVKRISWGAVFAGVIIAIAVQFLLSLLGTGIGMSTIDPAQGESPSAGAFGTGSAIWWTVSSLIALFAGGWTAAHLAGIPRRDDGLLHGLLTWSLSTLILLYFVSTAVGTVIGGAFNMIGSAVSAVAPKAADVASEQMDDVDISWQTIRREALTILRQTDKAALQPQSLEQQAERATETALQSAQVAAKQPQATDEQFQSMLDQLIRRGENVASAADQEAVVNVIVARTGMSREEASRTVQNWQQTYVKTKAETEQELRERAEATASAVARGSLWAFFAFLLGAAAAAFGGMAGRPRAVI